jgi:cytosine/adenosine deaminase-related metal-dependent hydrolase
MLSSGITTFADFREGGASGIKLLKEVTDKICIRAYILGRPDFYFSENILEKNLSPLPSRILCELDDVFRLADGVGLSSPNEFTDIALKQVADKMKGKKIISTHVCEHPKSSEVSFRRTGFGEVDRAIEFLKADYLVHLTYATERDLEKVAEASVPVVCCPRANAILGLKFPPIEKMIKQGIIVALGTDNVMINSPDLFREMDYVSKFIRAMDESPHFPSPMDVFKMVTINAAKALKIDDKVGSIAEGKLADLVLISCEDFNLRPIYDPFATIVHRARQDNIKMVMVNGEICIDRL